MLLVQSLKKKLPKKKTAADSKSSFGSRRIPGEGLTHFPFPGLVN